MVKPLTTSLQVQIGSTENYLSWAGSSSQYPQLSPQQRFRCKLEDLCFHEEMQGKEIFTVSIP